MSRTNEKGNIEFVCEKHARKADRRWAKKPLGWFVGKFVKKKFPGIAPDGQTRGEQMWVKIDGCDNRALVGTLSNDPFFKMELKLNDRVRVYRKDITQVLDGKGKELSPDDEELVGYTCPRCKTVTYARPGITAVACKWGRCNGVVREASRAN